MKAEFVWRLLCPCILCMVVLVSRSAAAESAEFPGKRSSWHGFDRYDFRVADRGCLAVIPRTEAPGRPWIWRARFFGHEPQTDIALLEKGFYLVYMDVAGLFGCPTAVHAWDAFYTYLTSEHGFAHKAALEGMSRGGLIIYNWAIANPDKVCCIYADAPVCDFKSWPGGKKGTGKGDPGSWQACLKAYGLSEEEALAYPGNPIDNLEPLAKAGIPLLHVCGAADTVVPVVDNTQIMRERYEALGGSIEVIMKPDCGHHPHSLKDPSPIVDFVLAHTPGMTAPEGLPGVFLTNCARVFRDKKSGRAAFLGGSITEMEGYRPLVCRQLQQRFPDTVFDFINAGLSSTCSTTGAFRLATDVLQRGPVDLLFVEFAVNDNQDARHSPGECIRGMEGIVRHARSSNPQMAVVFLYCANESHIADYQAGRIPEEIAAHAEVAAHYGIPAINFAEKVAAAMTAGDFDWARFGGCHPSAFGNTLYGDWIAELLANAWDKPTDTAHEDSPIPPLSEALDAGSYSGGGFLDLAGLEPGPGWQLAIPSWNNIPGQKRARFTNARMFFAEDPGAVQDLAFTGTAVGVFVVAGPDAGQLAFSIDDSPVKVVELYHSFSANLHYPRTVMLADDLPNGQHRLQMRVADTHHPRSSGHAVRIVEVCVNRP